MGERVFLFKEGLGGFVPPIGDTIFCVAFIFAIKVHRWLPTVTLDVQRTIMSVQFACWNFVDPIVAICNHKFSEA